ncbi:MAG TPA: transposase [Xanthomonadaceae bacterium]|jgi:putative transposase
MARLPRFDLPGVPQHVIQRGNDRQPCFASDDDRERYLQDLREAAARHEVAVHAYVLMTNHVHLLATPPARHAIAAMMQALGRRYVAYFNHTWQRTGTLWEGRYKACVVDTDRYLLTCYRYIELNPVRAAMVEGPAAYRWSSHRCNANGESDALVVPHERYLALGDTGPARQSAYRAIFAEAISSDELARIRDYLQQQRALGDRRFQGQVEELAGRCATIRPRGHQRRVPIDVDRATDAGGFFK